MSTLHHVATLEPIITYILLLRLLLHLLRSPLSLSQQLLVAREKNANSSTSFTSCFFYLLPLHQLLLVAKPRWPISSCTQIRGRSRPDTCDDFLVRIRPNSMPLAWHHLHTRQSHLPNSLRKKTLRLHPLRTRTPRLTHKTRTQPQQLLRTRPHSSLQRR